MWLLLTLVLLLLGVANADYSYLAPIRTGSTLNKLGYALDHNDEYLAIGEPGRSSDAGGGYLYDYTSGGVLHTFAYSTSIAFGNSRECGKSVSVDGDHFILGCPGLNGRFAAFNRPFSSWVYDDVYELANPVTNNDKFGYSVSVVGDRLVVSNPWSGLNGSTRGGCFYTYLWVTDHWELDSRTDSPVLRDNHFFGYELKQVGDVLVVSAYDYDTSRDKTGAVYVYRWVANAWVKDPGSIYPAGGVPYVDAQFGYKIDFDGTTIVATTPTIDSYFGGAWYFRWNGTHFADYENNPVRHAAVDGGFQYGNAATVNGNNSIVCAPNQFVSPGYAMGACYVHYFDGTTWVDGNVIKDTSPANNENFGTTVTVYGDNAVVGSWKHGSQQNGQVVDYSFVAPTSAPTEQPTVSPTSSPTPPPTPPTASPTNFPTTSPTTSPTIPLECYNGGEVVICPTTGGDVCKCVFPWYGPTCSLPSGCNETVCTT